MPIRKEVKTMKYEKPEVVVLASAVESVRGAGKFQEGRLDSPAPSYTINAYEADE
jgi:hypothetical protein